MNNDTKRFDIYTSQWGEYKFRIEEDVPEFGWYLYFLKMIDVYMIMYNIL